MITYKTGNLLDAPVEALVNTVNTVGNMDKGIALQIKNAYPQNIKAYSEAVKKGKMKPGEVLVVPVKSMSSVKFIINFPAKTDGRNPSKLAWVKSGLQDLRRKLLEYSISSVALPPLGAGSGGLNWNKVKPEIEAALGDLAIDIFVYEPFAEIQSVTKK